jgi:hypothetical protein
MIIAASDEPLKDKEANLKRSQLFALDQPGPQQFQSSGLRLMADRHVEKVEN